MFDRLEDILLRFHEIEEEMMSPDVINDQNNFRKLRKEHSDLSDIVEKYMEYKTVQQSLEESLSMLENESDEEMRELVKEEFTECKLRLPKIEEELKILLLPKDPNDEKNVIVEIRGGAGGDEAALFAAELYRMYVMYAERYRWKIDTMNLNENGIGGYKEAVFMINGKGCIFQIEV